MADWRTFFGLDQGCKDRCGNDVGPAPGNACDLFGVDANGSEKEPGTIQLLCEDLTKGFHCKTINFLGKLNAWTKGFLCWLSNHESRITNIEEGGNSLSVGLDNQIPYVNGTNDDLEYKETLTFDHAQDELNVEHITTNSSVATSEEFGAEADTQGTNNSLAVGYRAKSDDRSVSVGANSESGSTSVAVGEESIAGDRAVAEGYLAEAFDDSTAVGYLAKTTGIRLVAVGISTFAEAFSTALGHVARAIGQGTAVGYNSDASTSGVAVGANAEADAQGIAIGWRATAIASYCIALGRDAIAGVLASREFVAQQITHSYFGLSGVERLNNSATIGNFFFRTTGGLGTDMGGDNLHLQAGSSTGAGVGGRLFLGTSQAGTTGTTRRDQVDMWSVNPDGNFESVIDGAGIVLISPDGLTTKTLTIDNTGTLVVS